MCVVVLEIVTTGQVRSQIIIYLFASFFAKMNANTSCLISELDEYYVHALRCLGITLIRTSSKSSILSCEPE